MFSTYFNSLSVSLVFPLPFTSWFNISTLNDLDSPVKALISVTPDEETYDEEDAAFCLEMLLRIVLENRWE